MDQQHKIFFKLTHIFYGGDLSMCMYSISPYVTFFH